MNMKNEIDTALATFFNGGGLYKRKLCVKCGKYFIHKCECEDVEPV